MPRILSVKKIDGQYWARLDMESFIDDTQPVSLYTENEISMIRGKVRNELIEKLQTFFRGL